MNRLKFHIICILINAFVLFSAVQLSRFLIEFTTQSTYFARGGQYLEMIYIFGVTIVSWLATFLVFYYKKINNHYRVLMVIFFLFTLIGTVFRSVLYKIQNDYEIMFIDIMYSLETSLFETWFFILITSLGIHFSQKIIGKKVLPKTYTTK